MDSIGRKLDELAHRRDAMPAPVRVSGKTPQTLAETVGGREALAGGGPYWHLRVPFEAVDPATRIPADAFARILECDTPANAPLSLDPQQLLILDIETGGFAGTPVFLIGVVAPDEHGLHVEQYLARDYPEEAAILHALANTARQRTHWVTFNGKSFDAPFVTDRAIVHGVRLPPPQKHFDLLHAARRRWKRHLPDCRLGTLEQHILGHTRVGDVPSGDVPDLFHHFVRTGNAAPLRPVLEHNQIDLVSSAQLLLHLTTQ